MISQTADATAVATAATSPRELEVVPRPPLKREAEDPAVVIAVGSSAPPVVEAYRAASVSAAGGSATEAAAQVSASARVAAAPVRSDGPGGLGGAADPTSSVALSSLPARAGQRTVSMDPASPNFDQPARPPAPPPAPPAQPSPIGVEATVPAESIAAAKTAVARPADAEGPPNRQVSTVQVELSGAVSAQASQGAPEPAPAKRAQKASAEVAAPGQAEPVERVQANARRVGEIKEMMEYMRYEQDRAKAAAAPADSAPAASKEAEP